MSGAADSTTPTARPSPPTRSAPLTCRREAASPVILVAPGGWSRRVNSGGEWRDRAHGAVTARQDDPDRASALALGARGLDLHRRRRPGCRADHLQHGPRSQPAGDVADGDGDGDGPVTPTDPAPRPAPAWFALDDFERATVRNGLGTAPIGGRWSILGHRPERKDFAVRDGSAIIALRKPGNGREAYLGTDQAGLERPSRVLRDRGPAQRRAPVRLRLRPPGG